MKLNDVDIELLMRNRADKAVAEHYEKTKVAGLVLVPFIILLTARYYLHLVDFGL